MNSAIERLLSLRAVDAMRNQVVEICSHHTLAEAASLLSQHHVTGAPVVDEMGRCVGVISSSDFMRKAAQESEREPDCGGSSDDFELHQETPGEPFSIDHLERQYVTTRMTTPVHAVTPETPLLDVARRMCAAHVHRMFVLDPSGHVEGIISTLDILAATIQAVEE